MRKLERELFGILAAGLLVETAFAQTGHNVFDNRFDWQPRISIGELRKTRTPPFIPVAAAVAVGDDQDADGSELAQKGLYLVETKAGTLLDQAIGAAEARRDDPRLMELQLPRIVASLKRMRARLPVPVVFKRQGKESRCRKFGTGGYPLRGDMVLCPVMISAFERVGSGDQVWYDAVQFYLHELKHFDHPAYGDRRILTRLECEAVEAAASAFALAGELVPSDSYSSKTFPDPHEGAYDCKPSFRRVLGLRKHFAKEPLLSGLSGADLVLNFKSGDMVKVLQKSSGQMVSTGRFQTVPNPRIVCETYAEGLFPLADDGMAQRARLTHFSESQELGEPGPYAAAMEFLLRTGSKLKMTCFSATVPSLADFNAELGSAVSIHLPQLVIAPIPPFQ